MQRFVNLCRCIAVISQVLPDLMKQLAQTIIQLPRDSRTLILNELFSQVAESDDVIRKPVLVSWLQSLSYICSQDTGKTLPSMRPRSSKDSVSGSTNDSKSLIARL